MNIGAGRVVMQDLPRIDHAIEDGSLARNPPRRAHRQAEEERRRLPPDGPASPGGVHAHQDHMVALANSIADAGVPVWIHAFLDGRDMPPQARSTTSSISQAGLNAGPADPLRHGRRPLLSRWTATSAGTAWRWPTTPWSMPRASAPRRPGEAVDEAYAAKRDDEFVQPTVIGDYRRHAGRRRPADGQFPRRPRARNPDRAARSDASTASSARAS